MTLIGANLYKDWPFFIQCSEVNSIVVGSGKHSILEVADIVVPAALLLRNNINSRPGNL